jgi:hypothetical protein
MLWTLLTVVFPGQLRTPDREMPSVFDEGFKLWPALP